MNPLISQIIRGSLLGDLAWDSHWEFQGCQMAITENGASIVELLCRTSSVIPCSLVKPLYWELMGRMNLADMGNLYLIITGSFANIDFEFHRTLIHVRKNGGLISRWACVGILLWSFWGIRTVIMIPLRVFPFFYRLKARSVVVGDIFFPSRV